MKIIADKSFEKDLVKLEKKQKQEVVNLIQILKQIENLSEITSIKKLSGFKNLYRIRLGNFRIGFRLDGEKIILIRILHRKDIYKYFPLFL
ncbi:type II toxin-antitoxin system RelE family toxin [Mariniphaga sp.]|uniref:type II toxin-antitoxin system RelE family toxin n=1 Tax=Mariniphaga sp. TaxID=1954475 RepID=UPI003569723A